MAHRFHTDQIVGRATRWAAGDESVQAVVLYGSVHRQQVHPHSDFDLVIVSRRGRREQLWRAREEVAAALLGQPAAWSHELQWQGPYRFQAWTPSLAAVDLTFDEGDIEDHNVLAGGYAVLYGSVESTQKHLPAAADAKVGEEMDGETWVWLLGPHGWLWQGRYWEVYSGLVQLIDARLRPLITTEATGVLSAVVPAALEPAALLRALRATTDLYDRLRQSREPKPARMVLANQIRAVIDGTTAEPVLLPPDTPSQ